MQFTLFILLPCFFLFLFSLYLLSREDYIFLRKNISLEYIFDVSMISFLIALFFARTIFIVFHWRFVYSNPLVFLLFPYFPGLSLPGGILGVLILLCLFTFRRNIPFGRVFDIFVLSFLFTYSIGNLLISVTDFIIKKPVPGFDLIGLICMLLGFIIALFLFKSDQWKDGVIGILILLIFSSMSFVKDIFFLRHTSLFSLRDELLYIGIFVFNLFLLIATSNAFERRRKA